MKEGMKVRKRSHMLVDYKEETIANAIRKAMSETIEGVDPVFQHVFALGKVAGGICSARIDFQLGTNAADTNGLKF